MSVETPSCISFTEEDIYNNQNILAPCDARMLPRNVKGAKFRTGKCACGARCWPYASCGKCRAGKSIGRVMKYMVEKGDAEIVTDGRGRKGGRVWRSTEEAKARWAAEKAARTIRRDAPKVGRNDDCPCGSGKKYKKCCLQQKQGESDHE